MVVCDKESVSNLQTYITHVTNFLHQYRWIQDAYVSDFFFRSHWERLPKAWTGSLSQMSTEELSWLVDKAQNNMRQVLPLSLLSFRACTQAFSAHRQPASDIESKWRELVHNERYLSCSDCESRRTVGDQSFRSISNHSKMETTQDVGPVNKDGVLHYFYKKHVKPKKQHEIVNQSKVIQLLSNHIGCNHVVDVGGGLGHLSRLLSFGYGLKLTSVEASDGHAPKANKYDREVDKEIRKKINQTETESCPTAISTSLPHHVTSMIYPNMTAEDFLAIIQAQDDSETSANARNTEQNIKTVSHQFNNTEDSQHVLIKKHNLKDGLETEIASKVAKLDNSSLESRDETENVRCCCESLTTGTLQNTELEESETSVPSDTLDMLSEATDLNESKFLQESKCDKTEADIFKIDMDIDEKCDCDRVTDIKRRENQCIENQKFICSTSADSNIAGGFILTGLHACGDLTPTFLRFFVNCSAAKGLASVGCCYMKLSDSHTDHSESDFSSMGYPMSNFVRSLQNHELSYNSLELACHFADTYSKRLKDNPPHLKIHSYRAALEWIANQLCPDFKRSAVQIPAKKTNKMDFESYARLGLVKLGISPDLLTPDLLEKAITMTERWKDVVAFYTLRLSLAPVVETLVLLDRMMFLHEHGLPSILMPIFDPNISPRNFVLVAWK